MSYFTGTALSITDLNNSIGAALVASGWALNEGIYTKDTRAVRTTNLGATLLVYLGTGRTGATIDNESPYGVGVGLAGNPNLTESTVWPINYHIYEYETECYIAVRYNGANNFQWIAFGIADEMPEGEGHFLSGSVCSFYNQSYIWYFPEITLDQGGNRFYNFNNTLNNVPATRETKPRSPFIGASYTMIRASVGGSIHWFDPFPNSDNDRSFSGCATAGNLLYNTPGREFLTNALAPINFGAYTDLTRNFCKYFGQLKYCRYTRTDFYNPGQTITFGEDSWNVWPIGQKIVGNNIGNLVGLALKGF